MLNTTQIMELRTKEYYSSTYKIWNNIKYYFEVKPNSVNTISTHSKCAILITLLKFIFLFFNFFQIKAFIEFRNKNIEIFLNDDIGYKDIIVNLQNNRCLDIQKHDFRERIRVIKKSTLDIYNNVKFINDIKTVLGELPFDSNSLANDIESLLQEYNTIIKAWGICISNETFTITQLENQCKIIKSSSCVSEHMQNGELTNQIASSTNINN